MSHSFISCCNLTRNYEIRLYKEFLKIVLYLKQIKTVANIKHITVGKFLMLFSNLHIHVIIPRMIFCDHHDEKCYSNLKMFSITMISIRSWHWKILHGWRLFVRAIKVVYYNNTWIAMQFFNHRLSCWDKLNLYFIIVIYPFFFHHLMNTLMRKTNIFVSKPRVFVR